VSETDPVHVLDNPAWSALTGPQRSFGVRTGDVARFDPEISLFGAFAAGPGPGPDPGHDPDPDPGAWGQMAELIGPGGVVITTGRTGTPPEGWSVEYDGGAVQMTGEVLVGAGDPPASETREVVPLGTDDVPEMLELVALARPGPFAPRTVELGGYVGIRRRGRLVAMAGERLRPVGWAEISAVATHPDHRRQGLGELLVRVVAAGIVARGETPVLHAAADNAAALRLYGAMGFTLRRRCRFVAARAPGGSASGPPEPVVTSPG
jgi:ribosomal protein S18 acetylase RimI-like enzyme